MKIKFKSETFKRIFNDEEGDLSTLVSATIFDDLEAPFIRSEQEKENLISDYSALISLGVADAISYSNLSQDLINKLLKIGVPKKTLSIFKCSLDFEKFEGLEGNSFEEIESLNLTSIKNSEKKKERFSLVSSMKNLKSLFISDCSEALDLDKLFEDIPCPEKIESITLSGQLPSPELLSKFTGVKTLSIVSIEDSKKIDEFLQALPLENLTGLSILNSSLEELSEETIKRLESLNYIYLNNNNLANYNEILDSLPCKDTIETISFKAKTGPDTFEYNLQMSLLGKFVALKDVQIEALKVDAGELEEYLLTANLDRFSSKNTGLTDLNFIGFINPNIGLDLDEPGVTFDKLTPEMAETQKYIHLSDSTKERRIDTTRYKQGYALTLNLTPDDLFRVEHLVEKCSQIVRSEIKMKPHSNGVNQTLAFFTTYDEKCSEGYDIILQDYSLISQEQMDELNKHGKVLSVRVSDKECDEGIKNRFDYTPEQYKTIKDKVQEITADIPKHIPKLYKFMIIYRRLGAMISYDFTIVNDRYSKYSKENVNNCRNMTNGLLRNTCVCAGYADILYNCLREVGIESYKVTGYSGECHQWNKVKIDNILYNTDLTWDAPAIAKGDFKAIKNCLLGDKKFSTRHRPTVGNKGECPQNFDKEKLKEAFDFALEFDGIKIQKTSVLDTLKAKFKSLFAKKQALPEPTKEEKTKESKSPSWELSDEESRSVKSKISSISQSEPTMSKTKSEREH